MDETIAYFEIDDAVETFITQKMNDGLEKHLFSKDGIEYGKAVQNNLSDGLIAEIDRKVNKVPRGMFDIRRKMRCYGFDHALKTLVPTRGSAIPIDAIWFFTEVYVPHLLDIFIKIAGAGCGRSSYVIVTTDPRVFWHITRKSSVMCIQVSLWNVFFHDILSSFDTARSLRNQLRSHSLDIFEGAPRIIQRERSFVKRILLRNFLSLPLFERLFTKLLMDFNPREVVVGCDGFAVSRILLGVAKRVETKSSVVQHGFIAGKAGYYPLVADRIFVWTEMERNWFLKKGVSPERVVVTGSPKFDVEPYPVRNQGILSILVASTPIFLAEALSLYKSMQEISGRLDFPHRMKFRPHPFFKGKIRSALKSTGVYHFSFPLDEGDLEESLRDSDVVITSMSTLAIEAAIRRIPVIIFDSTKNVVSTEVYEIDACSEPEQVEELLRDLVNQRNGESFSPEAFNSSTVHLVPPRGAAERIAMLLEYE